MHHIIELFQGSGINPFPAWMDPDRLAEHFKVVDGVAWFGLDFIERGDARRKTFVSDPVKKKKKKRDRDTFNKSGYSATKDALYSQLCKGKCFVSGGTPVFNSDRGFLAQNLSCFPTGILKYLHDCDLLQLSRVCRSLHHFYHQVFAKHHAQITRPTGGLLKDLMSRDCLTHYLRFQHSTIQKAMYIPMRGLSTHIEVSGRHMGDTDPLSTLLHPCISESTVLCGPHERDFSAQIEESGLVFLADLKVVTAHRVTNAHGLTPKEKESLKQMMNCDFALCCWFIM